MDIDEFAHALGVVFCRPPLGNLDLAPGPMHIDADEEIDGAVAAVLVIVALELARFGRDRLAHLADELDRALVEAPLAALDRVLRHRGTSSMRATYSPSTRGMHHISLRQGLRPFSASRRRTVSPDGLSCPVSLTMVPASSSSGHEGSQDDAPKSPQPGEDAAEDVADG